MGSFTEFAKSVLKDVGGEIKRLLNDNVTGNVECSHCKKSGNILTYKKTRDGYRLCPECMAKLSFDVKSMFDEKDFAFFDEILSFKDYSEQVLAPKFRPDFCYKGFQADSVNGLVRVEGTVLDMRDLQVHVLTFEPEEGSHGILGARVKGCIKAMFSTKSTGIWFHETVDFDVTTKAKMNFMGTKFTYEEPKGLPEYVRELDRLIEKFQAEAN